MMIARPGACANAVTAQASAQAIPKIETHTRPQVRTSDQARDSLVLGKLERRVDGLCLAEHEVPGTAIDVDLDPGRFGHLAAYHRLRERILDIFLDRPAGLAGGIRGRGAL